MYNQKVLDIFRNPKNFGRIKNADGVGKVGNPVCGDVMHLYIKVGKNKKGEEIIEDIKFQTLGCVAAIATSSAITQMAKGKTIKEVLKINKKKVVGFLGDLPPAKVHCSVLAADAIGEAIYDYLAKNKRPIPSFLEKQHQRIEREKELIEEKFGRGTVK